MGRLWAALLGGLAAGALLLRAPPPLLLLLLLAAVGGGAAAAVVLRPLRLRRSLDEVGYLCQAGWSRAQSARRMRKSRRIGQLPPVFPNGWFRVLGSGQLPRGEVRSVAALGEQFAVFRDWDGKVHIVDAYCPHLGANLAVGGQVVGGCIECPFHGWTFEGTNGKCTRIPYAEKVPESAKIKVWPSCEMGGMIMVWYHCDRISPTWQVTEQEEASSTKWAFRGITEHFISAHIEDLSENAADRAHLSFLHHPAVMSGTDLRYTGKRLWAFFRHCWEAEWQAEPAPSRHCAQMLLTHHVTLFGKAVSFLNLNVSARQVGPGLVFLTFEHAFLGKGMVIQSITPLEPLLQQMIQQIYCPRHIPAFIPKLILWAERIQFERDIMIWNNKQFLSKPILVKEDAAILRHRRWFSQFYSENSTKFGAQKDGLDW